MPKLKIIFLHCFQLAIFCIVTQVCVNPVLAQQNPPCSTDQIQNQLLQDTSYQHHIAKIERQLYNYQFQHLSINQLVPSNDNDLEKIGYEEIIESGNCASPEVVYVIPVVFHVMYGDGDEKVGSGANISDAKIQTQVSHLNEAFRNRGAFKSKPSNTHPAVQGVDVRIEFRLAQADMDGKTTYFNQGVATGTPGICRWHTGKFLSVSSNVGSHWEMKDSITAKTKTKFDTRYFLNVFTVKTITDAAGFSTMAGSYGSQRDGMVVGAWYIANSVAESKVLVHEVGHYLNLDHTFLNGCTASSNNCLLDGDKICDTPPTTGNYGYSCGNTCSNDATSMNSPFSSDQIDLCEDYMDYSSVAIRNTFTKGQKDRMRGTLLLVRSTLLESRGLLAPDEHRMSLLAFEQSTLNLCEDSFKSKISVKNTGWNTIDSFSITLKRNNKILFTNTFLDSVVSKQAKNYFLPPVAFVDGTNNFEAVITKLGTGGKQVLIDYSRCQSYVYHKSDTVKTTFAENFSNGIGKYWTIHNPGADLSLEIDSVFGCQGKDSQALAFKSFLNVGTPRYGKDYLYSQLIDLEGYVAARLSFDRSYSNSIDNYNTVLDVDASTNCWQNFTTLYSKNRSNLATVKGNAYNFWKPTKCDHWKRDTIVLDKYIQDKILNLRFTIRSDSFVTGVPKFGNTLFLDNIKVELLTCPENIQTFKDTTVCADVVHVDAGDYLSFKWGNGDSSRQLSIKNSGQYFVQKVGLYNCVYHDTFNVKMLQPPVKSLPNDTLFCAGTLVLDGGIHETYRWSNGDSTRKTSFDMTSKQWLHVSEKNGCSRTDTFQVRIKPPAPKAVLKLANETLQSNKKGMYHFWYANDTIYNLSNAWFLPLSFNADYYAIYIDTSGCYSPKSDVYQYRGSVGIPQLSTKVEQPFPNPFESYFILPNPNHKKLDLKMFDMLGREVQFDVIDAGSSYKITPILVHGPLWLEVWGRKFLMISFEF